MLPLINTILLTTIYVPVMPLATDEAMPAKTANNKNGLD
jgi:hypothetical protein